MESTDVVPHHTPYCRPPPVHHPAPYFTLNTGRIESFTPRAGYPLIQAPSAFVMPGHRIRFPAAVAAAATLLILICSCTAALEDMMQIPSFRLFYQQPHALHDPLGKLQPGRYTHLPRGLGYILICPRAEDNNSARCKPSPLMHPSTWCFDP